MVQIYVSGYVYYFISAPQNIALVLFALIIPEKCAHCPELGFYIHVAEFCEDRLYTEIFVHIAGCLYINRVHIKKI